MFDKPLTWRAIPWLVAALTAIYAIVVAAVNAPLVLALLRGSWSMEHQLFALRHANPAIGQFFVAMVIVCISGSAMTHSSGYALDDEDEDARLHRWLDDDDDTRINPETGLIMIGATDCMGNAYGCGSTDTYDHSHHWD